MRCLLDVSLASSINDFQDGTTQEWEIGRATIQPFNVADGGPDGVGDAFVETVATGEGGPGGRLIIFNEGELWTGDYLAAGVTRIRAQVSAISDEPLNLRVALASNNQQATTWFASTESFTLPGDGEWREVVFEIDEASLTQVEGVASYNDVFSDVGVLRILSSEDASFQGDPIAATLRLDDVTAEGELPNVAPTLTLPTTSFDFTEGDAPVAIVPGVAVSDPDSGTLTQAVVRISSGFESGSDILSFTPQAGITGSFDADLGELTFDGEASDADYQALLQSVTFENTSELPVEGLRTFSIELSDGTDAVSDSVEVNVVSIDDAPELIVNSTPTAFTEGQAAIVIDSSLTLTDVDTTELSSATITISEGFQSGADSLDFVDQLGIVGSFDAAAGALTLSGLASIDDYQDALRSIAFANTSDNPTTSQRVITFEVSDGTTQVQAMRAIDVVAMNEPPSISVSSVSNSFTEGGAPVAIAPGIIVSDPDSGMLTQAIVRISSGFESGSEILSFTAQSGITGSFDANTGELTFDGEASDADYQTLLQSVIFENASESPTEGLRTFSIEISDGNSTATDSVEVNVVSVDDAPGLFVNTTPLTFTEGQSPITIDSGLTLNDVDSTELSSASVTISEGFQFGADSLEFVVPSGIVGSFDAATGTLTFSGLASVDDYEQALQSVAFANDSGNPSTTQRVITFEAADGTSQGQATRAIDVTAVNQPPSILVSPVSATFTEGDSPTIIDGAVSLVDVDTTTLDGAAVSIVSGGFVIQDQLVFDDTDLISGTYDATALTLTLSGTASLAEYQNALRSVRFDNVATPPSEGTRTIEFSFSDGDNTATGTQSVVVEAAPDTDPVDDPSDDPVDNPPTTPGSPSGSLDGLEGVLTSESPSQTIRFDVVGSGLSAGEQAVVVIEARADSSASLLPIELRSTDGQVISSLAASGASQSSGTFELAAGTYDLVVASNSLSSDVTFSVNALLVGDQLAAGSGLDGRVDSQELTVVSASLARQLSGSNHVNALLFRRLGLSATPESDLQFDVDGSGRVDAADLSFVSQNAGLGEVQLTLIGDQVAPEIQVSLQTDTSGGDRITTTAAVQGTITESADLASLRIGIDGPATSEILDLVAIDAGGNFTITDADLETINGGPLSEGVRVLSFAATDEAGNATTSDEQITFTLLVNNLPPSIATIPDETVSEDSLLQFGVSGFVSDPNSGDTVALTAGSVDGSALPSWLNFDSTTGVFSGTPTNDDVGSFALSVTATDSQNASSTQAFTLIVSNANDAPTASTIADVTIDEGEFLSLSIADAFSDVDAGDVLGFSLGNDQPDWITFDAAAGTLEGTPTDDDVGVVTLQITATDQDQASATASLVLTVLDVNEAPQLVSLFSDVALAEGDAFALDVSANFTDADAADTLVFTGASDGNPLPAWLTLTSAGQLSGSPTNDDVGTTNVTITASDGRGGSASDSFAFTVSNVNDAPTFSAGVPDQIASEDALFSLALTDFAVDVDAGDSLSFTATLQDGSPLPAWLSFTDAGDFSGTPGNDDVGTFTVTTVVTDVAGASAESTFDVTVENVNDAPVLLQSADDISVNQDEALSVDVSLLFGDIDAGDSLTYSASVNGSPLPTWLVLDASAGVFSGTPLNDDVGELNVTVLATDSAGESVSDTFTITVVNVNDPPVVENQTLAVSTDAEVGTVVGVVAANDPDVGDTLEFAITDGTLEPTFSLDTATGEVTLNVNDGLVDGVTFPFDVQVSDSGNPSLSDTATVTIVVSENQPPVANPVADQTATEDEPFSFSVVDAFTDPENEVLTFAATLDDGSALPAWLSFDAANATFSGTPSNDDTGELAIRVTATDLSANTGTTSFSLLINNVNDAPQVSVIPDLTSPEDAQFDFDAAPFFTDIDPADTLVFSANLISGDSLPQWLTISSAGQFSGTPTNDDVASLAIEVTATDSAGAATSGAFNLTVLNVNDAPVVGDANFTISRAVVVGDVIGEVVATDDDVTDTLTFEVIDGNASNTFVIDAVTGDVTVNDVAGLSSSLTFDLTVEVTDGDLTDTSLVQVEFLNNAPTVQEIADSQVQAGDALAIDVANAFVDTDAGDALTLSVALDGGADLPAWLSFDAATGQLLGTPAETDIGTIVIQATATDDQNETVTTSFDIVVLSGNAPPITATDAGFTTARDATLSIDSSELLGNDTDSDGDLLSITSVSSASALGASVSLNGQTITYDPTSTAGLSTLASDAETTDSFTYTVSDGNGGTDTGTVELRILGDELVRFRFAVIDSAGATVEELTEGEAFDLQVFVQDVSDVPSGLFSAYLDIAFPQTSATAIAPLVFPASVAFPDNSAEVFDNAGLLDEAGAILSFNNRGGTEELLFTASFTAGSGVDAITFLGDAADVPEIHDVLLVDPPITVPSSQINFGRLTIPLRTS